MYNGRSPSWGAWIEIFSFTLPSCCTQVAPPRGERGLKSVGSSLMPVSGVRRSPSWGAWIEIQGTGGRGQEACRRSPSWGAWIEIIRRLMIFCLTPTSLPLVGSVD